MYSIISDYLGKPERMYNADGNLVWNAEYDIYGNIRKLKLGSLTDCPFRYPGQYFDPATRGQALRQGCITIGFGIIRLNLGGI